MNGLNSSTKRQRLSGSIKTAITHSRCMLFVRHTEAKHKGKLEIKDWKIHARKMLSIKGKQSNNNIK